ncbi:MAG TPA: peptide-N4-asparagine amidase [Acidobacteriaceae bacterium]|nr:peptide-N4-asparagine amidase [Acidobacteriaceae bacterium]
MKHGIVCPAQCLLAALLATTLSPAWAQSPSQYQTGSSVVATADPPVARPHTKPCVVTLLDNQAFADFNNKPFTFTPPANCPGPWARVVFTGDFSIQAGVQYDRTAEVFFDNVDLYFGTTAEPLQNQTDNWHVERDVTDYSALFTAPQTGFASLGNLIEPGLNSVIFGTFKLEFYPANFANPAQRTADAVLPIPQNGGTVGISTGNPQLTATFNFPTNVEAAYLDVYAESQYYEEQWFLCVPNTLAPELGDCQNTDFREVEVSIDGTPAGVAPVYPWIYTGGIDPYLWIPIPGLQTLEFKPYRVDLTPFAAELSNGQPHTIGLSVYNAYNYFSADAALLLFQDHGRSTVTGAVTQNNLTAPNPTVTNTVSFNASGVGSGNVITSNTHDFTISGYVNTSHGRVTTTVHQDVNFTNNTYIALTASNQEIQNEVQSSTVHARTTTQDGPVVSTKETDVSYPFSIQLSDTFLASGDVPQVTSVDQQYRVNELDAVGPFPIFGSSTSNEVKTTDSTEFVLSNGGYYLGPSTGQSSQQTYTYRDSFGGCYNRTITAANLALTGVENRGCGPRWQW